MTTLALLLAACALAQDADPAKLEPVREKVEKEAVSEVYGVKSGKAKGGSVKAGRSSRKKAPLAKAAAVAPARLLPPFSSWEVRKAGRLVLRMTVQPGTVASRAQPQGKTLPAHPFLTASAQTPEEEDALRSLLDASHSASEFAGRLEKAGYTLTDVSPAPPAALPFGSAWSVYSPKGQEVLVFSNQPGTLASTALRAPASQAPRHPFLTAAAKDPLSEDALNTILDQSKDAEGFVAALLKAGYTVLPLPK